MGIQKNLDRQGTRTVLSIIIEGHIRIILAKFGQNLASSLGRDVI